MLKRIINILPTKGTQSLLDNSSRVKHWLVELTKTKESKRYPSFSWPLPPSPPSSKPIWLHPLRAITALFMVITLLLRPQTFPLHQILRLGEGRSAFDELQPSLNVLKKIVRTLPSEYVSVVRLCNSVFFFFPSRDEVVRHPWGWCSQAASQPLLSNFPHERHWCGATLLSVPWRVVTAVPGRQPSTNGGARKVRTRRPISAKQRGNLNMAVSASPRAWPMVLYRVEYANDQLAGYRGCRGHIDWYFDERHECKYSWRGMQEPFALFLLYFCNFWRERLLLLPAV